MSETKTETKTTIEKITKLEDLDEKVACENGHAFLSKNAKLIPFSSDNADLGDILILNKNHELLSGASEPQTCGYVMACPVCGLIQLSGFDPAPAKAKLENGESNEIPVRHLTLDL